MKRRSLLPVLVAQLRGGIRSFPAGFYDSFVYTTTGNNLTHPWTVGLLAKILWSLEPVTCVGIDVRFNAGDGTKFQPDLVAYDRSTPILLVDYESPNSSDGRIPEKDVDSYLAWLATTRAQPEYVIITTLPAHPCPDWEVRYTSRGGCNRAFRHQEHAIRGNPFAFWYGYYRRHLSRRRLGGLRFVNISGKKVTYVRDIGA